MYEGNINTHINKNVCSIHKKPDDKHKHKQTQYSHTYDRKKKSKKKRIEWNRGFFDDYDVPLFHACGLMANLLQKSDECLFTHRTAYKNGTMK